MNPNACEFVPILKMDSTEQRKYERQHLVEQITATKKHLSEQNTSLILLHTELNTDYAILSYQMNRRENQEFPCYSKEQIDLLHSKYTSQSQYYYKEYSKFNDLTSELLTLQQKLHRLFISQQSHTHTHAAIMSIHPSIMDGLSPENNHHSPSSTPCNVLPPIMESDAESSPWNEWNEAIESSDTHSIEEKKVKIKKNNAKNLKIIATPKARLDIAIDVQFENKINVMLDTIWNSDIKTISDEFDVFIHMNCVSNKLIEILIDCLIRHAVCIGKPVFFGSKYSLLCQSIIMSISKRKIHVKYEKYKLDLLELIWETCYETFRKLQFGNDSDKFINVCIIIAELFNANLLDSQQIFHCIFKDILAQSDKIKEINHDDICENDIEGIYEIFKRCHRSLNSKGNKKYLNKYLAILNHIKTWNKFQNGITRVPFMINQMQNTIKNTNRKY